jgi:hypothetical protein
MMRHTRLLVLFALLLLAACASPAASPYTVVLPPALGAAEPIPAPTGEVVLTVTGNIHASNVSGRQKVEFDLATLERLGLIEYSVIDDQVAQQRVVFQGVLLSDLLAAVQADSSAAVALVTAFDDYHAEIPLADFTTWPVMLATRADGAPLELGTFGPTRIVYPSDTFTFDKPTYDPRWVWSVATIDIR